MMIISSYGYFMYNVWDHGSKNYLFGTSIIISQGKITYNKTWSTKKNNVLIKVNGNDYNQ